MQKFKYRHYTETLRPETYSTQVFKLRKQQWTLAEIFVKLIYYK